MCSTYYMPPDPTAALRPDRNPEPSASLRHLCRTSMMACVGQAVNHKEQCSLPPPMAVTPAEAWHRVVVWLHAPGSSCPCRLLSWARLSSGFSDDFPPTHPPRSCRCRAPGLRAWLAFLVMASGGRVWCGGRRHWWMNHISSLVPGLMEQRLKEAPVCVVTSGQLGQSNSFF